MREPESMGECVYFTRRTIGAGKAVTWVFRENCPKCEKAKMGKPVDEKTGHAKIRAKEFVCPECGYTEEKEEYESKLVANIKYTCPKCKKDGEIQIPYKRKKVDGVDALVFNCKACNEKILITKKMKDPKAKGSSVEDDE